jgi:hypothetical protein
VYFRAEFYLLAILTVLFFERTSIIASFSEFKRAPFQFRFIRSIWIVVLIIAVSLMNKILNGNEILCTRDYYSSFYLLPFLVLVAPFIGKGKVFRVLILFASIEVLFGIAEYLMNTRSFFHEGVESSVITDKSLLYNSRTYGLSSNSSVFAYKVMIGLLLVEFTKLKKVFAWSARIVLLIGVLLSFSRSVVLGLLLFWGLRVLYGIIKGIKKNDVFRTAGFQFNVFVVILSIVFSSALMQQLSRGGHEAETAFGPETFLEKLPPTSCSEIHAIDYKKGVLEPSQQGWGDKIMMRGENIQSSGRKLIWLNYLNFIEDNLLLGNGSDRLMLRSWQPETQSYKLIHAHNSFLMLIGGNGVLISLLYLLFFVLNFGRKHLIPIIAILFYSLLNFGIFWGFSYLDVVFLIFLMLNLKDVYDNEGAH